MKGIYFIDLFKSFTISNPDAADAWKQLIIEEENKDNDVAAFSIPKRRSGELIVAIEKLLTDKLK